MTAARRMAFCAALAVALAACSSGDDVASVPTNGTADTSTSSTTSTSLAPPPETSSGVATWPLIDAVPAHRKAGVLVVSGVDYEPVLDSNLGQVTARLSLMADKATFALAPERGEVPFDQIQMGRVNGPVSAWPFVITSAGDLTVFVHESAAAECANAIADPEMFASYGVVTVDGAFAVASAACGAASVIGDLTIGQLPATVDGVNGFGVLLHAVGERLPTSTIELDWLALADSTNTELDQLIHVDVVGREHAIAERSADPDDDAALSVLHVLRSDGTGMEIAARPDGSFEMDRDDLGDRAKLWVDDYGLEQYVQQGPWIDATRLVESLTIDMAPDFEPPDESPSGSRQHRRPHELQIFNGSTNLERQQFHGLNWNNNLAHADRDRDPDNPNDCARAAWFGGSYVQALQTRVDQKPALIAEALLDLGSEQCHEIFSIARSLYSVETHVENARSMVEDFGVTHLIFAVSSNELCRMHDDVYSDIHGVAPDTPLHWRLIDGELVAPLTRATATAVEPDPDFDRAEACSFGDRYIDGDGPAEITDKMRQLGDLLEALGPDVEVTFFVMKDVLSGGEITAGNVYDACNTTGHHCVLLETPPAREKPEDLVAVDYNPYLLRYVGDGHPNARANQHIARSLVDVIRAVD